MARGARQEPVAAPAGDGGAPPVDIAANDPLLAYLQSASGPVDVDDAGAGLAGAGRAAGRRGQARRAAGEPGRADRRAQPRAAPVRAGVLHRRPPAAGQPGRPGRARAAGRASSCASSRPRPRTRERFEQELEVARLIQQNFLPKELPELPGWQVAALLPPGPRGRRRLLRRHPAAGRPGRLRDRRRHRQGRPGRAGDGRDPQRAARARPSGWSSPARCCERVNEHLCPDMPEKMFVTCFYGVLEPATGRFRFANAGHDVPYVKTAGRLGRAARARHAARPDAGMAYEEKEIVLRAGRLAAAALRRHRRGARPGAPDVRLPAAEGGRGRRTRAERR